MTDPSSKLRQDRFPLISYRVKVEARKTKLRVKRKSQAVVHTNVANVIDR